MENQLDKLFREKLANHPQVPPADAWARIEGGLVKKNKAIVAWRIAAALLLFGALSAYYFKYVAATKSAPQQISKVVPQKDRKPKVTTTQALRRSDQPGQQEARHDEAVKVETVISVPSNDIAQEEIKTTDGRREPETEKAQIVAAAPVEKSIKLEITLPDVEAPRAVAANTKKEKPVVLEYNLESMDDTSETLVAEQEKNTALKKVWAFAKDLNSGESQFSLRGMKNDLFAFDFRKDSTKKH